MQRLRRSCVRGPVCLAACLLVTCCRREKVTLAPAVEFDTLPAAAGGGAGRLAPIGGRVVGARAGQRIVLFAKSGVWWVQPFADRPFTTIDADATWKSTIHLGTEYAALLVEPGYRPSPTIDRLPQPGGAVIAVATARGPGDLPPPPSRKTLTFSGYEWEIRQTSSDRGGPNDYDAANAWTDTDGSLHLALRQREGRWTSAEVSLTRALGYGTYVFVVRDTAHLEPAAAVSLFTWDDSSGDQNHRELDVEISRWGDPASKNAQFVVQPYYVAANVARFDAPAGRLTHAFRWEPGRASFRTVHGTDASAAAPVVAAHEFTTGVPIPGEETVHMNLYVFRFSSVAPQKEAEVVIEKFQYLP